jgi:uncharacterized membrane protein
MRALKEILKWLFAIFFVLAGANHFVNESFYMRIMPDYIPLSLHRPAVIASGIAEIVLGVMLVIPRTQRLAAWGLIALLIAVFPANIYVYQHQEQLKDLFGDASPTMHLIRLPLQAVMILWAWWYTRPAKPA